MQSTNYFEKPYRTNWFWSMYVYMQMHSKSLEENPLNWGVKNSGSGVGNDFCFYTINAIFWFICFLIITYLGIISEILNAVKHVKSPLQCLAHSRSSWNTSSLLLWRQCQQGWSSPPWCAPWYLRIWARRRGSVFTCCLPSPYSLSFLTQFLWRQGSLSNSSARASRSAFAILTGCCDDAVTRLRTGAPGLSWCGCHGDCSLLERVTIPSHALW